MMTLFQKGLTIIAGGCRYPSDNGQDVVKYCDECNNRGMSCELEQPARKLAELDARRKNQRREHHARRSPGVEMDGSGW